MKITAIQTQKTNNQAFGQNQRVTPLSQMPKYDTVSFGILSKRTGRIERNIIAAMVRNLANGIFMAIGNKNQEEALTLIKGLKEHPSFVQKKVLLFQNDDGDSHIGIALREKRYDAANMILDAVYQLDDMGFWKKFASSLVTENNKGIAPIDLISEDQMEIGARMLGYVGKFNPQRVRQPV